jgi:hypothetical protein
MPTPSLPPRLGVSIKGDKIMNRRTLGLLAAAITLIAPLALISTGASAQSMSVLPTFSPATIQMPRTMYQPSNTPAFGIRPGYTAPSTRWACRAKGHSLSVKGSTRTGDSWGFATRELAAQRALWECGKDSSSCRIVACVTSR